MNPNTDRISRNKMRKYKQEIQNLAKSILRNKRENSARYKNEERKNQRRRFSVKTNKANW